MTQVLHQRILNGEIEPRATTSHSMTPILAHVEMGMGEGRSMPVARLPHRALLPVLDLEFVPAFIGREAEAQHIEERLHKSLDGHGALLAMDGEAGVGKTRLAYHVLQRAQSAKSP